MSCTCLDRQIWAEAFSRLNRVSREYNVRHEQVTNAVFSGDTIEPGECLSPDLPVKTDYRT